MEMDDTQIMLARHNQQLKILEKDIDDLKAVQSEIRTMNETLVLLATELKHTNEHLARHEEKINTIESQPKLRMQQIITAIIALLFNKDLIFDFVNIFISKFRRKQN